jgi:hypothetical protein
MTHPPDRWLSPPQVGRLLGIKADRVIALIRADKLPALDVRSPGSTRPRFRVKLSDVETALAVKPEPRNGGRRRGRKYQDVIDFF